IGIVAADEGVAARLGAEGIVVVRTVPGSPAQRAGLQGVDFNAGAIGDIIVAVNGKPVRRLADLTDLLEQTGVGHNVTLSVRRDGTTRSIDVEVVDVGRS
ncbi:MAG: PDZ domain-containing protein, partial [Pseudorhodoplanes sp.]